MSGKPLAPLPIDPHVEEVAQAVRSHGAAVVIAPPGSGKTTRIPPRLAEDGPAILLQPRRVAARAIAHRIAGERGWRLGDEVGWHVRFDRRSSTRTRLLVATEGILTARLQTDPLLSDFRTVILDEFHERSVHADLALALARQAVAARPDLRLVVMSATLDAGPVAEFLGGCPVIEIPGCPHPVEIVHEPYGTPLQAIANALGRGGGHVLCFLPGAPEIARLGHDLRGAVDEAIVLPLHGSLGPEAQDAALALSSRRKVILATNIAESALTIDGVSEVVDSGLHKILRANDATGIDRLDTERIPRDSADQRAGRAGRTGPGRAVRLWDPREQLRPRREPELARVDLAGACLEVLAWGADPRRFAWFEPPPAPRIEAALSLLERLGAARAGRITELGHLLARLPLHPRLARVLVAADGSKEAAAACAILSERWIARGASDDPPTTASDILSRVDRLDEAPHTVRQAAAQVHELALRLIGHRKERSAAPGALLSAILAGYPDRVAMRREPGSPRLLLASGHGAVLGRESGVREAEFLVAVDLTAGPRGPGSEAVVRAASGIDRDWLESDRTEVVHALEEETGRVRAAKRESYGAIVLRERPVDPDPDSAAELLAAAVLSRGFGEDGARLDRRLRYAGLETDLEAAVRAACAGRTSAPRIDPIALVPPATRRALDRLAPETLDVPSGRRVRLDYRDDGSVVCAVKVQELFGLAESPRLGPRSEPVVFELLAPNGRPVQTTRDLRGFWERTYPDVRRELRGRYPKHPWPDDPWTATPTHRTKGR